MPPNESPPSKSGGFKFTSAAWPGFFLALSRTIRECENVQSPSTGVRSLLHIHLDELVRHPSYSAEDRASLRKMMELLDDLVDNPPVP